MITASFFSILLNLSNEHMHLLRQLCCRKSVQQTCIRSFIQKSNELLIFLQFYEISETSVKFIDIDLCQFASDIQRLMMIKFLLIIAVLQFGFIAQNKSFILCWQKYSIIIELQLKKQILMRMIILNQNSLLKDLVWSHLFARIFQN